MGIRSKRKEKNLTQAELAKMVGVDKSAVSQWELGNNFPTVPKLQEMARIFDCSIEELIEKEADNE